MPDDPYPARLQSGLHRRLRQHPAPTVRCADHELHRRLHVEHSSAQPRGAGAIHSAGFAAPPVGTECAKGSQSDSHGRAECSDRREERPGALYQSASVASSVAQQVYEAEQKKYALGASTSYLVVQHQTDLANARQSEVAALSTYALAKLQLAQATGTILESNNISVDEAKNGRISKTPSPIPAVLPPQSARTDRHPDSGREPTPVANRLFVAPWSLR